MQINKEALAEKNYTGARLVKIIDPTIIKLQKELTKYQIKANPILKKMEKISPKMDPIYQKIGEHQKEIKRLQEELLPFKELYDVELKKVELIDQKAQLIKNKIQPIALKLVEKELGEFEQANQIVAKGNELFIEITDKLEDFIKAHRANKFKNAQK